MARKVVRVARTLLNTQLSAQSSLSKATESTMGVRGILTNVEARQKASMLIASLDRSASMLERWMAAYATQCVLELAGTGENVVPGDPRTEEARRAIEELWTLQLGLADRRFGEALEATRNRQTRIDVIEKQMKAALRSPTERASRVRPRSRAVVLTLYHALSLLQQRVAELWRDLSATTETLLLEMGGPFALPAVNQPPASASIVFQVAREGEVSRRAKELASVLPELTAFDPTQREGSEQLITQVVLRLAEAEHRLLAELAAFEANSTSARESPVDVNS